MTGIAYIARKFDKMGTGRSGATNTSPALTNTSENQKENVMADDQPTSVYLYYDESDILIYVGITARGVSRQREHNSDKSWWSLVRRQEVEHYDSRVAAARRETDLITTWCPPFNTPQNPDGSVRDVYLAYREHGSAVPDNKRVPLRVVVTVDRTLIAVTPAEFSAITATIGWEQKFSVSASKRKTRDIRFIRVGSRIAFHCTVTDPEDFVSGELMYRATPNAASVKQIDLFESVGV